MGFGPARGFRRLALPIAVALAGACAPASAQTPEPKPIEILPPAETELVQVDVVVTDKEGRPVTGLRPEDFLLLEDGRPQQVSHFLVAVAGRAAERPASASAAEPSVEPAPPGRHVVLAVDDLHMAPGSLTEAKRALKRFVDEQLADEDEAAVVTTSGAVGVFEPFTKDRWALRHAIDRLAYQRRRADAEGRVHMTEYQAEQIQRGDADALQLAAREIAQSEGLSLDSRAGEVVNPRAEAQVRALARAVLSEALDVSVRTLGTLDQVVRHLAPVPGRKIVVLVSDGFLTGQGASESRAFDLRRLIDASARSGVTLYALDSRGLVAEPMGGGAASAAPVVLAATGVRERLGRYSERAMRESMSALADGTGGFLVHGGNDLGLGLKRILRDSDACYLMAYEPATERDGRFHKIQVKLPRHPGLSVRARKGYFASDDRELARRGNAVAGAGGGGNTSRREREIHTALASLFPLRGVPLHMAAEWLQAAEGPQLVVRGHADMGGVRFNRVADRYKADLELLSVVYDQSGQVVGEVEGQHAELSLGRDTYEELLRQGLRYQRTLALTPGRYQVRMVAREGTFAQLGSASQWIDVPDLSRGTFTLSSVFLFAEARPGAGPASTPPPAPAGGPGGGQAGLLEVQALRRFERGKNLYYLVYVYNPVWTEGGDTDVVLQAQVWSGEKLMGASPVQLVPFAEKGGSPAPMSSRIALEGLAPGEYELRVLASDRNAKVNTLRRVGFSVD